jgi:DMSO/TMAO reductase YedYZ molybdopterin-dependent catalytic subunit
VESAIDLTEAPVSPVSRTNAGRAGMLAAAVALGVGELMSALLTAGDSSLVVAVGNLVIDVAPPFVEDFAISVFGTADKLVLVIGIIVLSAVLGAMLGRAAARRFWVGAVGLSSFGLVGFVAAARDPMWAVWEAALAAIVAAIAGIAALWLLVRAAREAAPRPDADDGEIGRRTFLRAGVTATAVAGVALLGSGLIRGREQREAAVARTDLGLPGPVEAVPPPAAGASLPTAGITPIITPNDDFYRIDTALFVPKIDASGWSLRISGRVDRPFEVTYDELLEMDLVERYVTIACVSNEVGGDLVGNARWLGVPLPELLERAGVQPGATQIIGRSVDGFTVGFPTEAALDGREALVAVGMNGEPLPFDHGFPARLIVAGLYGYVSATKWLSEIELTSLEAFDAYWIPRGWAKEAPIKTQARIDVPAAGASVPAGLTVIAGVAWAPHRGISRVEVQVDDEPWVDADLSEPLSNDSWVQWRAEVDLAVGSRRIRARATDGDGVTQTDTRARPRPDGASGYHTTGVRAT